MYLHSKTYKANCMLCSTYFTFFSFHNGHTLYCCNLGTRVFTKNTSASSLAPLSNLQSLSIENCGLGTYQCMWVKNLTKLTSLNLAGNHINFISLLGLRHLKELAKLDVSWTDVAFIPELHSLKELRMDMLELKPIGQASWGFRGLDTITMQGCTVSEGYDQIIDILR